MPVHQISVAPVTKDTTSNGRSSSRSRDKTKDPEGEKETGRSRGRSSNKASGSTAGVGLNIRTAVTPSAQDISSSSTVVRLEENGKEQNTPVQPMTPASESATLGKRQVKRRHRRRRESPGVGCVTECVESQKGEPEKEKERERSRRTHTHSDSSEEDERRWRESRSWNRKKTRRRRSSSQQGHLRTNAPESRGAADGLELLSIGSDEVGKENHVPEQPPAKSTKKSSLPKKEEKSIKVAVHRRASVKEEQASEEEQPIVKSYEEGAERSGNLSVPVIETTTAAPEPNGDVQTNAQTNVQTNVQTNIVPPDSDEEMEVCRICHCEGDEECPLITPCHCTGSLRFVHQGCLHQWIKSSDTRCCELCNYQFIMETHLKPLRKWEKLHMTTGERRKIFASVTFHLIAVACVLWSLYVLIDRTTQELRMGKHHGVVDWPFWTKLIVVSIGFTGGAIFMYIQCKVYLQLWRRLKAFNRIIFVQNCPETARSAAEAKAPASSPAQTNGRHEGVEVCPAPEHTQASHPTHSGGACVTPV